MTPPTQGEHAQTALAHELFAAAQLAPGEGIEDAVSRIAAALTAAPSVSDGQRALHESILNRLSHAELLEKAHYLMELNSNQARTIGELQDLVETAPAQPAAPQGVAYAELPEPESYLFQHDETGLTQFVDAQQVEWGFQQNNPRLRRIGGAYTADHMRDFADRTHALRASNGQAPAAENELWRERLLNEDIAWLEMFAPNTAVRSHIIDVLRGAMDGQAPAGAAELENLQRTAVGWQQRAEFAEREWQQCYRVALIHGADPADFKNKPGTPWHTAQAAPAADPAYSEACSLATALFEKHYRQEPDYASGRVVWSLCDTTAGVISQIDNMVSGLARAPAAGAVAGPDEVMKLVDQLVQAETSKNRTHAKYMGIAMPDDVYDRFTFLRDECIPELRAKLRAMIATAHTPAAQADSVLEDAARSERERICAAIKAEDDYCVDQGDYMLDSDDCIKIVRGEWVRPDFTIDAARKQGANHD